MGPHGTAWDRMGPTWDYTWDYMGPNGTQWDPIGPNRLFQGNIISEIFGVCSRSGCRMTDDISNVEIILIR